MQGFQTSIWSCRISDKDLTGFHESKLNGGFHQALSLRKRALKIAASKSRFELFYWSLYESSLNGFSHQTPIKEFETGLGGGNLQGSLSQRTLGYRSKRSEQSLVATTIKFRCISLWSILELKGHFIRADHVEVDERKNNRSMRISAVDRHQDMPRQMKINIDRCTQVPSIDVETVEATFWIQRT
ncbi:hypothetical protein YC2023_024103 [Brassica napus]